MTIDQAMQKIETAIDDVEAQSLARLEIDLLDDGIDPGVVAQMCGESRARMQAWRTEKLRELRDQLEHDGEALH